MRRPRLLGQHTLVDSNVVEAMVEAAELEGCEVVYEIGTGSGVLTRRLCSLAGKVVSCEVDEALYRVALSKLDAKNLKLIRGDGFDADVKFDVFISSLPYYCSSRFVKWLIGKKFNRAVVLLQKEFVQKLLAEVGGKYYRAISVLAQYAFNITPIRDVPPDAFTPKPKVQSTLVLITPKPNRSISKEITQTIYKLFALRKKKVSTAFKMLVKNSKICALPIHPTLLAKRVASLTPEEAVELAKLLVDCFDGSL
ncbi:MAG: 16S rRNA (adenine(1518)-N(6)/adenine(1519)-N(6))-dimethyltransferase RsmA [Nitrososphaerales archaeon]